MLRKSVLAFVALTLGLVLPLAASASPSGSARRSAPRLTYFNGFEAARKADHFTTNGQGATFERLNTDQAARGSHVLSINSRNNRSGVDGLTRWLTPIEMFEVRPGSRVALNALVRTSDARGQAEIAISFFGERGQGDWASAHRATMVSEQRLSGTTEWTRLTVVATAPEGSGHARVELRMRGMGQAWFDNVRLKGSAQTDRSAPAPDAPSQPPITVTVPEPNPPSSQPAPPSTEPPPPPDSTPPPPPDSTPPPTGDMPPGHDHGGGHSPPIRYTGPNQYNWQQVPTDTFVATSVHGRFRPGQNRGQQLFTVDCKTSHLANDDPIVHPGRVGGSHNHEFFGATNVDANTDVDDLLSNRNRNLCDVGADRSAYWTPVAYQDGQIVRGDNNKFYYKVGQVDPASIQPMPVGLRMVAGNASATSPAENPHAYLFTTTGENKVTEPKTQKTNNNRRLFTTRPNENGIRVRIVFPQCWDGEHLWLEGTAHMAYPNNRGQCPASHPVPLLQLIFNIGYSDATGGAGFEFSSGEWWTAHGDFINGWRPDTLEALTDACIRSGRYCGMTRSPDQTSVQACASRSAVRTNRLGCVEVRDGGTVRYHGRQY